MRPSRGCGAILRRDADVWGEKELGASAPDSDQEALPPGPPPRALPLEPLIGLVFEEGQPRRLNVRVGPPQTQAHGQISKGFAL